MAAAQQPQSMFDRFGGAQAVQDVVDTFCTLVLSDVDVAPFFDSFFADERSSLDKLRQHQASFLAGILGGPGTYTGRDMSTAHAGLGIGEDDFDRVLDLLLASMLIMHVPADARGEVMAAATSLRAHIVAAR